MPLWGTRLPHSPLPQAHLHGMDGDAQELMCILLVAKWDVLSNLQEREESVPAKASTYAGLSSLRAGNLGLEPPQPKPDVTLRLAVGAAPHNPRQAPRVSSEKQPAKICPHLKGSAPATATVPPHRYKKGAQPSLPLMTTMMATGRIALPLLPNTRVMWCSMAHSMQNSSCRPGAGEKTLGTKPGEVEAVHGMGDLWSSAAQPRLVFPRSFVVRRSSVASWVRRKQHMSPPADAAQVTVSTAATSQVGKHPCRWKTDHRANPSRSPTPRLESPRLPLATAQISAHWDTLVKSPRSSSACLCTVFCSGFMQSPWAESVEHQTK
ncbi:uncharacterized protein [Phaenicophaeus curvirostris]|uniref:uncharacterized protein n=1 Tax=Phaenicophaeus curvirostris TaxID=33595 RepID=UPI0037F0E4BC